MPRDFKTEVKIDASADRVWETVTSAEGIQSWFAPEARVTPGEGGEVWVSWGPGMEGGSRIGAWEPGRHFSYIQERPDAAPVVVEFLIEAGEGGQTTLRLVQSGFGEGASFDNEYESTSRAWRLFLFLLKHCAEHPAGRCRNLTEFAFAAIPREEAWQKVVQLPISGERVYWDEPGLACYEYPHMNRSLLAIFCEKMGPQTALTVMALCYGLTTDQESELRNVAKGLAQAVLQGTL